MALRLTRQAKLKELAEFEACGGFEDDLYRLTSLVGELMEAGRVSLMLLDSDHGKGARLKLASLYGELPEVAWKEEPAPGQGITGHVLKSGVSLRVGRLGNTPWSAMARRGAEEGGFIACPVFLAAKPAGVLNISLPQVRKSFSQDDQDTAELAAALVARAIQIGRLARMLDSRFAQMALTLAGPASAYTVTSLSAHDPDKVAKMLAKGFYKEMRHCGFTPNQIIHAAGEIISELTGSLNRHTKRLERGH